MIIFQVKIRVADAITRSNGKNRKANVFRRKEITRSLNF